MAITNHEYRQFDLAKLTVEPGQVLRIETSPDGEEALSELCPEGETWNITIHVRIEITD